MIQRTQEKQGLISSISVLLAALLMAMVLIPVYTSPAYATTANLNAAKAKYSVGDDRIMTFDGTMSLQASLDEVSGTATAAKKCIVYLPEGSYKLSSRVIVPENVILVGEAASKVSPSGDTPTLIELKGSLYGGYFDGLKKAQTVLKFRESMSSVTFLTV